MKSGLRAPAVNRVFIVLSGCVHEGYSVRFASTDEASARGAWANLRGREPRADHQFESWVNGRIASVETRTPKEGEKP